MKRKFSRIVSLLLIAGMLVSSVNTDVFATDLDRTSNDIIVESIQEEDTSDLSNENEILIEESSEESIVEEIEDSTGDSKNLVEEEPNSEELSELHLDATPGPDGLSEIDKWLIERGASEPEVLVDLEEDAPAVGALDDDAIVFFSDEQAESIPSKYNPLLDAASDSYLPQTRNQNPYGTCWAHATMASMEINLAKNYGYDADEIDLSEGHLAWFMFNYPKDPLGNSTDSAHVKSGMEHELFDHGGNLIRSMEVVMNGVGPASEANYPYSRAEEYMDGVLAPEEAYNREFNVKNVYVVNTDSLDDMKRALMEYGALGVTYYSGYETGVGGAQYCPYEKGTNHAVTCIGWDDDYPASNFGYTAPGNGAWLIRNSWSTKGKGLDYSDYSENYSKFTYFWLSYYDKSMNDNAYAFVPDLEDEYDYEYFLDGGVYSSYGNIAANSKMANIFTVSDVSAHQLIKNVSFETWTPNVNYTVKVYKNLTDGVKADSGTLAATQTGSTTYAGIYKIPLDSWVAVDAGTKFSVVVSFDEATKYVVEYPNYSDTDMVTEGANDIRSVYNSGSNWYTSGSNYRIKAFTDAVDDATDFNISGGKLVKYVGSSTNVIVPTNVTTIGTNAFSNTSAESVRLYDGVTTIESGAFSNSNIKELTIPGTVTSIGTGVFEGSATLEKVVNKSSANVSLPSRSGGHWINESDPERKSRTSISNGTAVFVSEYKVVFNSNGGSGTAPNSVFCTIDETYRMPSTNLTKTGNVFSGWSKSSSGTGTVYRTGQEFSNLGTDNETVTLYAVWKSKPSNITAMGSCGDCVSWTLYTDGRLVISGYGDMTDYKAQKETPWYSYRLSIKKVYIEDGVTSIGSYSFDNCSYIEYIDMGNINRISGMAFIFCSRINDIKWSKNLKSIGQQAFYAGTCPKTMELPDGLQTIANYCFYSVDNTELVVIPGSVKSIGSQAFTSMRQSPKIACEYGSYAADSYSFSGTKLYYPKIRSVSENPEIVFSGNDDLTELFTIEGKKGTVNYSCRDGGTATASISSDGRLTSISGPGTIEVFVEVAKADSSYIDYGKSFIVNVVSGTPVKVNFNANGGTVSQSQKTVYPGAKYGELPVPTKDGYMFTGWYTQAEGGTQVTENTTVTNEDEHTLYAHWKEKTLTIEFDANGGTCGLKNVERKVGTAYGELPIAIRIGYDFLGWFTDKENGTKILADTVVTVPNSETESITVFAHWQAKSVTVSFDVNDEEATPLSAEDLTKVVSYDATYGALPTPVFTGFEFLGWYTEKVAGEKVTDDTVVKNDSDHTLYAHWRGAPYIVTFDANGGKVSEENRTVYYKSSYGEESELPIPERPGYDFVGWYTDGEEPVKITEETIVTKTSDHTLYAKWEGKEYTVTFNALGGTIYPSTDSVKKVKNADVYGILPVPGRENSVFVGWYLSTGFSDEEKIEEDTIVDIVEDITFYAKYSYKIPNIVSSVTPSAKVSYGTSVRLRMSDDCDGAVITYRLDGTEPTGHVSDVEKLYSDAFVLDSDFATKNNIAVNPVTGEYTVRIRAIATKAGWRNSELFDATFTVETDKDWGDLDTLSPDEKASIISEMGFNSPYDIPSDIWVAGIEEEVPHTGNAITCDSMRVFYGKKLLDFNTDYKVSYANNKNAGTATVTISAKGNYAEKIVKQFTISKLTISGNSVSVYSLNTIGNGKVQKISPIVMFTFEDGHVVELKKDRDYVLSYPDMYDEEGNYIEGAYKDEGTYRVDIIAKANGNYTGSMSVSHTIFDKEGTTNVNSLSYKFKNSYVQSASGESVELENLEVIDRKLIVHTEDDDCDGVISDYEVTYLFNDKPGTAKAIITGTGEYVGTKVLSFRINGISMSKVKQWSAEVSKEDVTEAQSSIVYDGEPKTFGIIAPVYAYRWTEIIDEETGEKETHDEEEPLVEGKDYVIEYKNNIKAGTATATIVGKGRYVGKKNVSFKINKADISDFVDFERNEAGIIKSAKYVKGGARPGVATISGNNLKENTDYTLSCTNNTKFVSDKVPTATITGKGNYTGKITEEFTMIERDIRDTDIKLEVSDVVFVKKAKSCKPSVTLTDVNGKKLANNTDYKIVGYEYVEDSKIYNVVGKTLVEGFVPQGTVADFNTQVPMAGTIIKVKVEGKGMYGATSNYKTATFKVAAASIASAKVAINTKSYTGKEIELSKDDIAISIKNVPLLKTDYEIIGYEKNINKGTGYVYLKGVGTNYGGIKKASFKIDGKHMFYRVVYHGNADGVTGTMVNSFTAPGGKLTGNKFKRQGYVFNGWSFSEGETEPEITVSNLKLLLNRREYGSTVHLYAQWKIQ